MKNTGLVTTILGLGLLAPFAGAQTHQPQLSCDNIIVNLDGNHVLQSYCEMREMSAAFVGSANVDATPVGSISIHGWDQSGVLIRAQVVTYAPDNSTAVAMASEVTVTENAGVIRQTGPAETSTRKWQVGYEIFMPHGADLTLTTSLGPVAIQHMRGQIRCTADTGGIELDSANGDVACQTLTGPVSIVLSGDHWDGQGLVAQTKTGPIDLTVPDNYSAHLEVSTGIGPFSSAIPLPVVQNGRATSVSTDLGTGGATINVSTITGPVNVHAANATSNPGSCDSQSSLVRHGVNDVARSVPVR